VAGGAVLSGPLTGLGFGVGGTPYRFIPGNNTYYNNAGALNTSAADSVGGTPNQSNSAAQIGLLSFPLQQGTAFGYASYKITPDIQAGLMLNYGYDRAHSSSLTISTSGTIKTDNAYLDPTIQARMLALGVASFAVSSNLTDGINLNNPKFSDFYKTVGAPVSLSTRQLYRAVFTLDGALGDDWSWAASYQHSESHLHQVDNHIAIVPNFLNAVDAVRVTTANVGASGAQVGSIVCRSTLTAPANGCVPFNIMGTGVQSQASVNYINDDNDWAFVNIQQDTAGASMQGKLPWDLLDAGAPSIAFGAEYRKEAEVSTAAFNPTHLLLGGGNFQPSRGEFNVEEGFAELDVPLIKNGIVQDLSANLAGRYTSYSISGAVETWKLGLSSQVNDDVRLRTTWSYDIRAPNLGELFGAVPASGGAVDPKTGANVSSALTNSYFNRNLQPEKSTTVSGGVVLTPHWVPGLTMSFDWYSINVKGIISTPTSTITLNFCNQGVAAYCNNYVYNAAVSATNPNGLGVVLLVPANNGFLTTSGLDFQADYEMDCFTGNLALNLLGNYTDEESESVFGQAAFDRAGSMGNDSIFYGNVPKMHVTLAATYNEGPWSGTLQTRYIGTARVNNAWTSGVQIDNNAIPAVAYMDLRGAYKWNDNVQLYGAIDNFWDTPPPNTVSTNANTNGGSTTDVSTYDTLGRMYHAGIRFSF
jgi:iron complex outermembrane receptor protein